VSFLRQALGVDGQIEAADQQHRILVVDHLELSGSADHAGGDVDTDPSASEIFTGRVEPHGDPTDPVYALEYGTPEQTVLLVYGRANRPTDVSIRHRTIDVRRRYRIATNDAELNGVKAATGVPVPFTLAPDADVIILNALE
jgi:hypothetical protein